MSSSVFVMKENVFHEKNSPPALKRTLVYILRGADSLLKLRLQS